MLHILSGRFLLIFSGISKIGAVLFFALMPSHPNYWAFVMPAMVAETAFSDVIYTVTNVFITTSMPAHLQGVAGALINCTLYYGVSFVLGVSGIGVNATAHLGEEKSFKVAFWIGVGFATVALGILATIDIGKAKSELTIDEKRERDLAEPGFVGVNTPQKI